MIHFDILPKNQQDIYPYLCPLKKKGFILFGGTAIALQLGHRVSVDFDFFVASDIEYLKEELLNFDGLKIKNIIQNEKNSLVFLTQNNVKLSFFGNIWFAEEAETIDDEKNCLLLAGLKSLLATKLKATCDRAEYKDYKDIVEILRSQKVSLYEGMELFSSFFKNQIPEYQILKGLQYFEDGDLYKLSKEDRQILFNHIEIYNQKNRL